MSAYFYKLYVFTFYVQSMYDHTLILVLYLA